MKKIGLFVLIITACFGTVAQNIPPEGISFQAVVLDEKGNELIGVDAYGNPLSDKTIDVAFRIVQSSVNGPTEYAEIHSTNTDSHGLFNLIIGQGQQTSSSSFENIDWGTNEKFLVVEVDVNQSGQYTLLSAQKLWSVPYALYSKYSLSESDPSYSTLLETSPEMPGVNCANGGTRVEVGPDLNANGVLDPNEILSNQTSFVCNGEAGVGIISTVDNGDGTFTLNYSDGTSFTTIDFSNPGGLSFSGDLNFPDGFANMAPVSAYVGYGLSYIVPAGMNFYWTNWSRTIGPSGNDPAEYFINGVNIKLPTAVDTRKPFGNPIILSSGDSISGNPTRRMGVNGFLVPSTISPFFLSANPYVVVPQGKIMVLMNSVNEIRVKNGAQFYSFRFGDNTDYEHYNLPIFIDEGDTVAIGQFSWPPWINGYYIDK